MISELEGSKLVTRHIGAWMSRREQIESKAATTKLTKGRPVEDYSTDTSTQKYCTYSTTIELARMAMLIPSPTSSPDLSKRVASASLGLLTKGADLLYLNSYYHRPSPHAFKHGRG